MGASGGAGYCGQPNLPALKGSYRSWSTGLDLAKLWPSPSPLPSPPSATTTCSSALWLITTARTMAWIGLVQLPGAPGNQSATWPGIPSSFAERGSTQLGT